MLCSKLHYTRVFKLKLVSYKIAPSHLFLGVARIALLQHPRKRPERHPHVVLQIQRALHIRDRRLGLLVPAVPL